MYILTWNKLAKDDSTWTSHKKPDSLAGAVMLFVHCTMWAQNGHSGQFVQSHTQNGWKMLKDIQNKQKSGKSFGCFSVCFIHFDSVSIMKTKPQIHVYLSPKNRGGILETYLHPANLPTIRKKKIRHFSGITHLLLWNTLGRKLWAFFKLSEFSNNSSTKKTLQVSHFCSSSFHNNQSFLPFICWMLWIPVPNMAGQLLHVFPRGDLSCAVASKFGCPNLPWKLKEGQWGLSIGSIDLWMYLSVRMQKTWHDILCYHNVHYIYLYMYIFVE